MELTRLRVLYDPKFSLSPDRAGITPQQANNLLGKCIYAGRRVLWCKAGFAGSLRQIAILIGVNRNCNELVFANEYDGDVGNLFYYDSKKFGPLMLRLTRSGDSSEQVSGVSVNSRFSAFSLIPIRGGKEDLIYKLGCYVEECYLTAKAEARTCSQKGIVL